MNRTEYIEQRLAKKHFSESDYVIISSLIHSLTPDEACSYLDLTFEQDYRIRRYVLKKISNDISKSYTTAHKKLVSSLIKLLDKKGFGRKESCSYSLDFLIDSLPTRVKRKILETFLGSKSIRNRDRAFKRLNAKWDKKYFDLVEQVWYSFHDSYCLGIILNHFPTKFLLENYKTILQHTQPFQTSKLFLKLGAINFDLVAELKKIDGISYCYVLTKFGKAISDSEAKTILKENYKDERIGLLLWSFGQMGLWDRIVEYDDNYRENTDKQNLKSLLIFDSVTTSNEMTANFERHNSEWTAARTANKGFAIAGVPCFADIFVQDVSSVLRMKYSAKTPRHRKPPKR